MRATADVADETDAEVAIDLMMPGLKHVETTRLILRRLVPSDATAYHALMTDLRSDDSVTRFLNLEPLRTIDQYAMVIGSPRNRCHFAVIHRESGAFIGVIGFLWREPFLAPEIYVWLARESRGHSLGPEAVNALIDAAFSKAYCDAVIGIPHIENVRSIKSLAKMDMKLCASVVDIGEAEPGAYVFGREHKFPIFCRERMS